MNKTDTKKAQKLGKLLAESPLEDEIKQAIIDNIDKMPMDLVDKLIYSLENEQEVVDKIAKEVKDFIAKRDKAWADLGKKQQAAVDEIIDKEEKEIEKEAAAATTGK